MLLQRRTDIAMRPSAIDVSTLTNLPRSPLAARASAADTTRRIWIITGVVILVSLIVIGAFCAVVLCLMHKKKRQRQKQRIDLGASNAHAYRPVENMELEYRGVQELPAENSFSGGGRKAELGGDVNEVPRVQMLDGYTAAPKAGAQPVELPGGTAYKNEYHR